VRRSGVRIKKRKDNEVELIVAVLDVTAGILMTTCVRGD
jgi:hypothetical protein